MPLTADASEPLLHTGTPGVTDVTFRQIRQLTQLVTEGVVGGADLKVSAPGGMNVQVASGYAFVTGTTITGPEGQHKYGIPLTAAKTLGTITAPVGATRRDTVILRAYDEGDAPGFGGLNVGRVEYLVNGSETLTPAALPANSIALAYVDVPVGAAAITTSMIRDTRKRARTAVDEATDRIMRRCFAFGEGIAPIDQRADSTIAGMGLNRATDFEVTTGGSGLTLSIALGNAWVLDDTDGGLHFVRATGSATITMTAAHATNPRIDRVVLDKNGGIYKVDGTPTGGATLTNLTGAPALPADAIPLAYVLTPALFAGPYVNATHLLDVRYLAYRPGRTIGLVSRTTDVSIASPTVGTALTLDTACDGVHAIELSSHIFSMYSTAVGSTESAYIYDGTTAGSIIAGGADLQATATADQGVNPPKIVRSTWAGRKTHTLGFAGSGGTATMKSLGCPNYLIAKYL